jgi:hypothetical protein
MRKRDPVTHFCIAALSLMILAFGLAKQDDLATLAGLASLAMNEVKNGQKWWV